MTDGRAPRPRLRPWPGPRRFFRYQRTTGDHARPDPLIMSSQSSRAQVVNRSLYDEDHFFSLAAASAACNHSSYFFRSGGFSFKAALKSAIAATRFPLARWKWARYP